MSLLPSWSMTMVERSSSPPTIAGHTLIRPLGSGGYADVYLFQQATPNRQVAIKVLRPDALHSEADQRQFLDEANTMAALSDHPNIVQVFSVSTTDDGRPYIAMMFYPRPSLDVQVRNTSMTVADVLSVGIKVASAVETAHRAGILHRDIKPANILQNQYGEPGLTDFGIALTKGALSSDSEGLSIPWSPPEVLLNTRPPDERADIYSLAATVWHLLVGHSPFFLPDGDNSEAALEKRILTAPVPKTGRPDVSPELERVLALAMAKDPQSRPLTAYEFAEQLRDIEIAHQWVPTQILVTSETTTYDDHHAEPTDSVAGDNRTRLRNVQLVKPQTANGQPTHPEDLGAKTRRPTRSPTTGVAKGSISKGNLSTEPANATVVRKPLLSAEPEEPTPSESTTGSRRTKVGIIAVAVALVLAAGVTLVLVRGHTATNTTAAQKASTNLAGNPNSITNSTPIGTPTVKITGAVAGKITISWTYSGQQKGDRYRYRINDGPWTPATTTSVSVAATQGLQICAQVQVERANGSATSAISPQVCG